MLAPKLRTALPRPAAGTPPVTPAPPAAAVAVRLAWLGLFASVLWYVYRYGIRGPYQDEWFFTAAVTAPRLDWHWVWALHAEHRYPVGKMLWWLLTAGTGDFRTGAVVTACLNAGVALGLAGLARRLRGRAAVSDVLFPALLLNWGQFENYLFGYQVVFSLTVAGMAAVLAAAATCTRETAFRAGLIGGAALLVVVQGGGYGLAAVGPVGLWLAAVAFGLWRTGAKGRAFVVAVPPLLAVAYSAVIALNIRRAPEAEAAAGVVGKLVVFLQAVGCGLGDGVATRGFPVPWAGMAVAAGFALAGGLLARVIVRDPEERLRSSGVGAVLAWGLMASAAIAMVRPAGYAPRYAGPAALCVCGLLLATILYGPTLSVRGRRVIATLSLLLAGVLVAVNVPTAKFVGKARRGYFQEFEKDLKAGVPPRHLGSKYVDMLFFPGRPMDHDLKPLAAARFGLFADMVADPVRVDVPLPFGDGVTLPAAGPEAFVAGGKLPSLTLWAGPPREVQGVRVRFAVETPAALLTLVVRDETGKVAAVYRRPDAGDHEALFWIGRTASELRLEPASLSPAIRVRSATLEVPAP